MIKYILATFLICSIFISCSKEKVCYYSNEQLCIDEDYFEGEWTATAIKDIHDTLVSKTNYEVRFLDNNKVFFELKTEDERYHYIDSAYWEINCSSQYNCDMDFEIFYNMQSIVLAESGNFIYTDQNKFEVQRFYKDTLVYNVDTLKYGDHFPGRTIIFNRK